MANDQDIRRFMEAMRDCRPKRFFDEMDKSMRGAGHVLRYLYCKEGYASPGEISRCMHVSTARMAVLLQKMEQRSLIARTPDPMDARKYCIHLTDEGRSYCTKREAELFTIAGKVIDEIGMERLMEFAEISKQFKSVVEREMEAAGAIPSDAEF